MLWSILGQSASVGEMGKGLSHPTSLLLAILPRAMGGVGSSMSCVSYFGDCLNH